MKENIFSLILTLKGFNLDMGYNYIKKIQQLETGDFLKWQDKARWDIFNHHFNNNIHYKSRLGNSMPSKWEEIPITTKSDLQNNIDILLTSGFSKDQLYINNTSGSSGHPFFFAKNKECHSITWGIIKERYERHGIKLGSKQARFYGIPLTWKSLLKEKLKDILANRVRFPVFDLSDRILFLYLKKFETTSFEYIYGYTSAIVLFARFLSDQKMILKNVCPSLKACIVTSEMCSHEEKQIMAHAFGCKIIIEYGASELDFIAIEDEDGDWITTEESLYIEVLDDNNKPLQAGNEGKLVITSLFNKAMPFIRYEIGDRGILSVERKGKYRILQELTGRINDFAILPSGKKAAGLTFYYISKSLLEANGIMKEFIIKQTSADTFIYEYVADRELNQDEKDSVNKMMHLYLESGLKLIFEKKTNIERSASGKLKHFHSILNQN